MNWEALQAKPERYGIGLMSGSSCDGMDAALVRLRGEGADLHVKLLEFETTPYPEGFRARLLAPRHSLHEACVLSFDLGDYLADAAAAMMSRAHELGIHVDFIASHGHTLAHIPPRPGDVRGATLQIGEPAIIAEQTRCLVISDFRPRDMAAGGQGAPLVPFADWVLFHRDDRTVLCLNIGGIANLTVVPPYLADVIAFDTGPGNMILDAAVRLLTQGKLDMDEGGRMAARGTVISELLEAVLAHPFFAQAPPKSTGREEFGPGAFLNDLLESRRSRYSPEDILATLTESVAASIADAWKRFVAPHHAAARLIVSGGGALNPQLLKRLERRFESVPLRTSDDYGLPAVAREALAFAVLGNETLCQRPSNVPGATGAHRPVILGNLTLPQ